MASSLATADVAAAFTKSGLVPDVIKRAPTALVKVYYGEQQANLGNELTPEAVNNTPTAVQWDGEPNQLYTFVLADPDAPTRQNATYRSWRHYVVVNITGSNISTGQEITSYIGAKPPANTGFHRYAFLVFKQNGTINPPAVNDFTARRNWNVSDWAATYNLGDPVAGNFFEARHDDDRKNGVGTPALMQASTVVLAVCLAAIALL